MKKIVLFSALMLMFVSCGEKFNFTNLDPVMRGTFSADMSGLQSEINKAVAKSLMKNYSEAEVIIPESFCYFSKYEVSILYISLDLYNEEKFYENYVILNRESNDGVIVDLAKESLSDKVDSLFIENPIGNRIGTIQILIDKHFIVNGIMKLGSGKLFQTTSEGIFSVADGTVPDPQDCDFLAVSEEFRSGFWSRERYMEDFGGTAIPPQALEFQILMLNNMSNAKEDKGAIYFPKDGVVDIMCPLDLGMRFNNYFWQSSGLIDAVPFVEGGMEMEVYYAKRKGSPYYTDWLRFILSPSGEIIPGVTRGYSFYMCNSCEVGGIPYPSHTNNVIPGERSTMVNGLWEPDLFSRIDENTFLFDQTIVGPEGLGSGKFQVENFRQLEVGDSSSVEVIITGETNETFEMDYMRAY